MKRKKESALNALQRAQLQDCIRAGCTVKVNRTPKSLNKGWSDTGLFKVEQPKLF